MIAKNRRERVFVFFAQNRTGYVKNPAARLDETRGLFQGPVLLRDTDRQGARSYPPLCVRIAPPGARAGAWRIDENKIAAPFETSEHIVFPARRMQLNVTRPAAFESGDAPHESGPIAVGRVDLALVLHRRGKRQGFAARARAKIEHLLAWFCEGKNRGELRAFVLNFGKAFDVGRAR